MAKPDLHKFEQDLKNNPTLGSTAPPRTIRAKDLDGNNKKLTLLEGEGTPKLYEVEYTADGTRITRILPQGSKPGDLLYYDGSEWKVFPAVTSATLHVLGIQNGTLQWVTTEDC
jgi:hypothetical protein